MRDGLEAAFGVTLGLMSWAGFPVAVVGCVIVFAAIGFLRTLGVIG